MTRNFSHRVTGPLLGPREVLELMRATRANTSRDAGGVPVAPGAPHAPVPVVDGGIAVTWLGHASALVQVDGLRVLVDPVLGGIPGNRRRLTPPGATLAALGRVDVLLITHDHYDHLDDATVRGLPRSTRVVVGLGAGRWFARRGFTDVTELDWWESVRVGRDRVGGVDLGATTIEFVPAHHWSRRGPFDKCRRLWGGWVVTAADGRAVVHAGDTGHGVFPGRIGERHRSVALALLPVGAYAPRHLLRRVHMSPEDAVAAAADLGARRMVPIHWGTFVLTAEPVAEPLALTRAAWTAAGRDPDDLWDLAIGETRTL